MSNIYLASIPLSEIDEIIRDAHMIDKVGKDMVEWAMGMQWTTTPCTSGLPNPPAPELVVVGGSDCGGGGMQKTW